MSGIKPHSSKDIDVFLSEVAEQVINEIKRFDVFPKTTYILRRNITNREIYRFTTTIRTDEEATEILKAKIKKLPYDSYSIHKTINGITTMFKKIKNYDRQGKIRKN